MVRLKTALWLLLLGPVLVGLPIGGSRAAEIEAGPGDGIENIIRGLGPGDVLILADGIYDINERFSFDIAGTAAQPITIRAAAGARPHFRQLAGQNIWDIRASHVVIQGLEFSQGSAGLRIEAAAHLTIADCTIHDTADVALRLNDSGQTYQAVRILRNHIHHTSGTGEGMYLGCNADGCRLAGALIAGNHVHHTDGPGVSQGDGIELKEGSHDCIIRDNVIHHTNYPCILTYSTVGNGGPNRIEGNVLWACGDHGIQTAADAVIRNNILLGARYEGIALQPHQAGSPANLRIVHNTVIQPANNALALRGVSGDVLVANNALYAAAGAAINPVNGDFSQLTVTGNVGRGGVAGGAYPIATGSLDGDFVAAHFDGGPPIDVFPRPGSVLIEGADPAHVTELDFNHTPRGGQAHAGAYHYDPDGNPCWTLAAEFKNIDCHPPGPDGSDDGGGWDGGVDAGTDAGVDGGRDAGADAGRDAGADPGADAEADIGADAGSVLGDDTGSRIEGGCGCRSTGRGGISATVLLLAALWLMRSGRGEPARRRSGGGAGQKL